VIHLLKYLSWTVASNSWFGYYHELVIARAGTHQIAFTNFEVVSGNVFVVPIAPFGTLAVSLAMILTLAGLAWFKRKARAYPHIKGQKHRLAAAPVFLLNA
jgi:hypothetical protein